MYTICSLFAICSILRPTLSFVDLSPNREPNGQRRANWTNRQKRLKNKRLAERRGASHGRFPKEKRHIYTEFTPAIQPPSLIISSHGRGHPRLTTRSVAPRCCQQWGPSKSHGRQSDVVDVRTQLHDAATRRLILKITKITRPRLQAPFRPQDCFHCCSAEQRRKSVHRTALFASPYAAANFLGAPKK